MPNRCKTERNKAEASVANKYINRAEHYWVRAMLLTKLKKMVAVLLVAGILGIGAGTYSVSAIADNDLQSEKQGAQKQEKRVQGVQEKNPPKQEAISGAQQLLTSSAVAQETPKKEQGDDPKKSSKQPAAETSKIRELLTERVEVLRKRLNIKIAVKHKDGQYWNRVRMAFMELLRAELELCESEQERLGVQLTSAKECEKVADGLRKVGSVTQDEFLECVADRVEIEIAYERAKAKATKAKNGTGQK